MDQNNIMFMGNMENSYAMVNLYQNNKFFGYKDSHNCYDIDVMISMLYYDIAVTNVLLGIMMKIK